MKKCRTYTREMISRYVDNELPQDLRRDLEAHLEICRDCRTAVTGYTHIDAAVRHTLDSHVSSMDTSAISSTVLEAVRKKKQPFFRRYFPNAMPGKIVLQLASIAAIVTAATVWNQDNPVMPAGPSAIVTSVAADTGSVMVLESASGNHTIIWYTES